MPDARGSGRFAGDRSRSPARLVAYLRWVIASDSDWSAAKGRTSSFPGACAQVHRAIRGPCGKRHLSGYGVCTRGIARHTPPLRSETSSDKIVPTLSHQRREKAPRSQKFFPPLGGKVYKGKRRNRSMLVTLCLVSNFFDLPGLLTKTLC